MFQTRPKHTILFLGVSAAIFMAALLSFCSGKFPLEAREVWQLLCGQADVPDLKAQVFWTLRFPRSLMAILAGSGLGLAGAVYQIIFKNPLASPDIIGVAGGANLGAAIAIVAVSSSGLFAIASGAFWGGLAALLAVLLLVKLTRSRSTATYVLAGIVINAISKACIMALKYFADTDNELQAMEYWEMGSFGNTTMAKLLAILPMYLIGFIGLMLLRRQIGLLALSDEECGALGVRLGLVRTSILMLSTLMIAAVISVTGLIAFAGLIAPHSAHLMLKRRDTAMLLMSALLGALIVLLADICARMLYSTELPISILTTLIGVPILLYFLLKRERSTL